jgi:hypothetical protein
MLIGIKSTLESYKIVDWFLGLCRDALTTSLFIQLFGTFIREWWLWKRNWSQKVVVYFKVLHQHIPKWLKNITKNIQARKLGN